MVKRKSIKFLSVLLSVLMLASVMPSSVYAIAAEDIADNLRTDESVSYDISSEETSEASSEVYALGEDVSKRTENAKYIRMSDGSYYVAVYDSAVHYLDGDVWEEIDNTLASSSASGSDDVAGVATSKGKHTIKFANNSNSSKLVAIKQGNYKISFNLVGANKSKGMTVTNPEAHSADATELERLTVVKKAVSSVMYEDILDGVDLEYVVNGNNLKENIIVKNKANEYVYHFDMTLDKLTAEQLDDGKIVLMDEKTGEVVYTITTPYMVDANGKYSDKVTYSLEQVKNKEYRITVTADGEWMNDESRVFPVTIDPPISVSDSIVTDLDISENNPNTNYSSNISMLVSSTWHSYWKISELPELPSSAYITEATISLNRLSGTGNYIGSYEIVSDWDSTLTWNKTISDNPEGVFYDSPSDYNYIVSTNGVYGDNGWFTWDITGIVQDWYDGYGNYGVGFKIVDGTISTTSTSFRTNDNSNASTHPCFIVKYKDMKGVESYWTYGTQNAGFAGTGYLNYATGNLVFGKSLLSTTDSLMSYSPSLVYNSSLAGKAFEYPNAQCGYSESYMPLGFKLSIGETIL